MAASQFTPEVKSPSGAGGFFREVKTEMKKVTWPTKGTDRIHHYGHCFPFCFS